MSDDINDYTQRIKQHVNILRESLDKELSNLSETLKNQSGDIHTLVRQRKEMADELELDDKLSEIYHEIAAYKYCFKKYVQEGNWDEWDQDRTVDIDKPILEESEDETRISFELNGKKYTFLYIDKGSSTAYDGDDFHHTKLILIDANGVEVIGIDESVEFNYMTEYRPFGIFAFKPGDWMQNILEFYELYQANKKRKEIEGKYKADDVKELKDNFDL